ncbi:MAG: hypothetical protein ACREC8_10605 [Limisphaerales bacterium]
MKKILLIATIGNFITGAAIFIYDAHFFYRFDMDANEVLGTDGSVTIDWPTGERPLYAILPAWIYGSTFWLISFVCFTWLFFLCKAKTGSSVDRSN